MIIPKSSLIVSCQAPFDSPLFEPKIITAMAKAAINQGAKGIRINTPDHIKEARKELPNIPIIGLWKQDYSGYDIYITPCYQDALAIAEAGADVIAIDGTLRKRPQGEKLADLIDNIHQKLGKLVMADVDTIDSAIASAQAGADFVGTTLYGYTKETANCKPPGFSLLEEMSQKLTVPISAEGGISAPEDAKKALDYGAYSVVVGTAITGIDLKVQAFQAMFK